MKRVYIVAHETAYRAFEDYYNSLKSSISCLFDIQVIVYKSESDIPVPASSQDTYLFLSQITPKFFKLYRDGKHKNIYLINTEQSTRPIWAIIIKHYMNEGINIFDYNQYQTEMAKKMSPERNVYYLPYQVNKSETEKLTSLIMDNKKLYDVAFCATNNSKKRMSLFNRLKNEGLSVIDVYGWGESRDKRIAQAKILVNVHHGENYQIFEHIRCDRWVLSGMLVISEDSLSDELMDCKDLIIISRFENILAKIIETVANYNYYYLQYLDKLNEQRKNIVMNRRKYCRQFVNLLKQG